MNYPEGLWQAAKAAYAPGAVGQYEKTLKLMFLQGMHSGRELVSQSTQLDNNTMCQFNTDLRQQIEGSLSQLGHKPGKIDVGLCKIKPATNVKASINGEKL